MGILHTLVFWVGLAVTLGTGIPVFIQLIRNHPKGLMVLFFAEMWERFSYYGMRGLLVYYLTQHFLFDDKFSTNQYGSYTTLVYLLPLIGGYLADRYLGTYKAVAFGAILLVVGQFGMAIHAGPSKQFLDYTSAAGQHVRYEVVVPDGRPGVPSKLKIGDKTYEMASDKGNLTIKNLPADAGVPATLPASAYKLDVQRDQNYINIFYLALGFIIMGVGFLKANISAIVGQLYEITDPRRDPAFTLYYYGVNLGAFWAAVVCGYFGQNVDWGLGFGLAGAGMALGWISFIIFKPALRGKGAPPNPELLKKPVVGPLNREVIIYVLGLLGVIGIFFLVQHNNIVGMMLGLGFLAVGLYLLFMMITKFNKIERERLFLALLLVFGAVVFFTLFEQAGSSLSLFADRNTDLNLISAPKHLALLGHDVVFGTADQLKAANIDAAKVWWVDMSFTSSQTQTFNAGFILLFAPIFAWLWGYLGARNRDPNPMVKFGLGLLQVGLGFMVLVWSAGLHDASFRLPLYVLALTYLLHTTGELFLSPVGLSQITKLAPVTVVSTLMATWFLASSAAQFIGGRIAAMAGSETVGGQVLDPGAALDTSLKVFQTIGLAGIGAGVLFLLLSFVTKQWAHGVNDTHAAPGEGSDRGQEL